jgi:predicted ArsR family transcriptional regulator
MSIRKRTQDDVIEYIKNHASEEGKLQQSLMDIAGQLGYSNATIHRVLKSLEEQGIIEVQAPEKPTQPNTIIFNGPIETEHDILAHGAQLMNEVEVLAAKVQDYVRESHRIIENLKAQKAGEQRQDLTSRVTEIVDMPDGNHYMLIVKKESDEELNLMRSMVADKENHVQA